MNKRKILVTPNMGNPSFLGTKVLFTPKEFNGKWSVVVEYDHEQQSGSFWFEIPEADFDQDIQITEDNIDVYMTYYRGAKSKEKVTNA